MDILLITQPQLKQNEAHLITKLFDAGLKRLHVRKPAHSALEISCLLDAIPEHLLTNIVIHRHPELVADYGLAGYHHMDQEELRHCKGTSSRSIHSLSNLSSLDDELDYAFFGPVYKSISKKDYEPKVALPKIKEVLTDISKNKNRPKIYALGGIRRKKIIALSEVGFDGFALLGSIWGHSDPVNALIKFNQTCLESFSYNFDLVR